jgi:hypothetical protein
MLMHRIHHRGQLSLLCRLAGGGSEASLVTAGIFRHVGAFDTPIPWPSALFGHA